jgi:hypothetical protein
MTDVPQPPDPDSAPAPTEQAAVPSVAAELDQAVAAFDAQERSRSAAAKPVVTPFSLRDVDSRVWVAVAAALLLVAVGLGGPPWQASFWITLGLVALISSPFVVAAVFLWQRERR